MGYVFGVSALGKFSFLVACFFLLPLTALSADPHSCQDWIALIEMQHQLAEFREKKQIPPRWLLDAIRIKTLSLTAGDQNSDFPKTSTWQASDADGSTSSHNESHDESIDFDESETSPDPVFSLATLIDDFEEIMSTRFYYREPENATDAIWRRFLAEETYARRHDIVHRLWYLNIMTPSQQVFALELWNRQLSRNRVETAPQSADLQHIAEILSMPPVSAVLALRGRQSKAHTTVAPSQVMDLFQEIIASVAQDRLQLTADELVTRLAEQLERGEGINAPSFGTFFYAFLTIADPAIEIRNAETLRNFVAQYKVD